MIARVLSFIFMVFVFTAVTIKFKKKFNIPNVTSAEAAKITLVGSLAGVISSAVFLGIFTYLMYQAGISLLVPSNLWIPIVTSAVLSLLVQSYAYSRMADTLTFSAALKLSLLQLGVFILIMFILGFLLAAFFPEVFLSCQNLRSLY